MAENQGWFEDRWRCWNTNGSYVLIELGVVEKGCQVKRHHQRAKFDLLFFLVENHFLLLKSIEEGEPRERASWKGSVPSCVVVPTFLCVFPFPFPTQVGTFSSHDTNTKGHSQAIHTSTQVRTIAKFNYSGSDKCWSSLQSQPTTSRPLDLKFSLPLSLLLYPFCLSIPYSFLSGIDSTASHRHR